MKYKIFSALLALALLSGCGIRPNTVDPPQGTARDHFPHTYPKPTADAP